MRALLSIYLGLAVSVSAAEATPLGKHNLRDLTGHQVPVPDPAAKATVLIFLSTTCPICNAYAPELGRIATEYKPRGVALVLVQTEPELTEPEARKHAADFALPAPVILDPRHELVKAAGASTTPQVVIVSGAGAILYKGRIDDRFPALGKDSIKARSANLRLALDEILAGKIVSTPTTTAIGCALE